MEFIFPVLESRSPALSIPVLAGQACQKSQNLEGVNLGFKHSQTDSQKEKKREKKNLKTQITSTIALQSVWTAITEDCGLAVSPYSLSQVCCYEFFTTLSNSSKTMKAPAEETRRVCYQGIQPSWPSSICQGVFCVCCFLCITNQQAVV